jgi:hypothetical protein
MSVIECTDQGLAGTNVAESADGGTNGVTEERFGRGVWWPRGRFGNGRSSGWWSWCLWVERKERLFRVVLVFVEGAKQTTG